MCTGSGHTAEQTEKLFKNISGDFQKIRQRQRISGIATEQPTLRNSHELYLVFDQYFALYFPQGVGGEVQCHHLWWLRSLRVSSWSLLPVTSGLGSNQLPLNGSTSTFSPQPSASSSQLQSHLPSCLRTQTGNCCDGSMGPMLRHDRLWPYVVAKHLQPLETSKRETIFMHIYKPVFHKERVLNVSFPDDYYTYDKL